MAHIKINPERISRGRSHRKGGARIADLKTPKFSKRELKKLS